MRLWHYALLPVLPTPQLVAQWRELSAIAGSVLLHGTPNHLLVNPVMSYPFSHLYAYALLVRQEMLRRGLRPAQAVLDKLKRLPGAGDEPPDALFPGWHTTRYLLQCYFNLQEKYDRGGVSPAQWQALEEEVARLLS